MDSELGSDPGMPPDSSTILGQVLTGRPASTSTPATRPGYPEAAPDTVSHLYAECTLVTMGKAGTETGPFYLSTNSWVSKTAIDRGVLPESKLFTQLMYLFLPRFSFGEISSLFIETLPLS